MNVTYSEEAKQWEEGYALLRQATSRLDETLAPSTPRINAEWDITSDPNGLVNYSLRLSDWTGSVRANFAPDEFKSPLHLNIRLYRLLGELLQQRNHKQLQELAETGE